MAENLDTKTEWGVITVRVPPELAGYGPSLTRFFDAMVYKLRRNAHKGKWEAVPLSRAMAALRGEAEELEEALAHGSTTEILMEAVDTANQALIVAEIALEVRGGEAEVVPYGDTPRFCYLCGEEHAPNGVHVHSHKCQCGMCIEHRIRLGDTRGR